MISHDTEELLVSIVGGGILFFIKCGIYLLDLWIGLWVLRYLGVI